MWQFQVFKAYAKKQSGYTIKILRTNKGIEHIIYDDFLKKKKEYGLSINWLQDTPCNKNKLQSGKKEKKKRTK